MSLLDSIRNRLTEDRESVASEYAELVADTAAGKADIDSAAAFIAAHGSLGYSIDRLEADVKAAVEAAELKRERQQALKCIAAFNLADRQRKTAAARDAFWKMQEDEKARVAQYAKDLAAAKAKLAECEDAEKEKERLEGWLRMTAAPELKQRQEELARNIGELDGRVNQLRKQAKALEGDANTALPDPNAWAKLRDIPYQEPNVVRAAIERAKRNLPRVQNDLAASEAALAGFREELEDIKIRMTEA